jgi:uncharacterized membrane protein YphA (DoxX/SURF4 family)
MNFSTTTIMPFLARLVVAAAMLTSGWVNCFSQVEIRAGIAEGLRSMDIEIREHVPEVPVVEEGEELPEVADLNETMRDTTRGVNRMVWLIHDRWPDLGGWGTLMAWTASVSQLLAGVLLLVGFFTRFAALAVCCATGMAVYIVSGGVHGMFSMNPFEWPLDTHRFIQLFAGLGLFTLSLGLFLGGGGGMSLDRRHSKSSVSEETK